VAGGSQGSFGPPSSSGGTLSELDFDSAGYINLEDHVKLPSVEAAARVSKYRGSYSYGVGESNCVIMGIDRYEFPQVAFYRDDFAGGLSLGALMNELGSEYYGVIIPTSMAEDLGFQKGDHLLISFTVADTRVERDMIIVGTYDYFPTVYPARDPTIIVNLESLFDNPEEVVGYNIWLKLRKDADINYLTYQIRQLIGQDQAVVVIQGNAIEDLKKGQEEPERVGLFGILNVGFLTTGLMPGIGFVLYSYASLRRRFIQLGILQAIGLSVRQLVGYLVSEQILLMGTAILTGAGIGLLTSFLFVPFLQVGAAPGAPIPPFEVLIGWTESLWLSLGFSVVLFLTTLGTIIYLARLKVFQAVKMGESL
jgi:putative ABC transport system permease protein